MKKRMSLWLPVIFVIFHLLIVGGVMREAANGGDPEGVAFALAYYEWPLLVLCKFIPICHFGGDGPGFNLVLLSAGSLAYALIGFLIGAPIDWARNFIARRREEG